MNQRPYLNVGAGRIILPAPRPAHHALVPEAIFQYPLWVNADRNAEPGIDCVIDLFQVPWIWTDNSFDGMLMAHFAEHLPHDIRLRPVEETPPELLTRRDELAKCQDGWYAIFAEVWRVLTPGARVYILSPYAWSNAGITDPTHTRLITESTFTHSMQPDPDSPFRYETGGINFQMVGAPVFNITDMFRPFGYNEALLQHHLQTQINVAYEIAVTLEVVK